MENVKRILAALLKQEKAHLRWATINAHLDKDDSKWLMGLGKLRAEQEATAEQLLRAVCAFGHERAFRATASHVCPVTIESTAPSTMREMTEKEKDDVADAEHIGGQMEEEDVNEWPSTHQSKTPGAGEKEHHNPQMSADEVPNTNHDQQQQREEGVTTSTNADAGSSEGGVNIPPPEGDTQYDPCLFSSPAVTKQIEDLLCDADIPQDLCFLNSWTGSTSNTDTGVISMNNIVVHEPVTQPLNTPPTSSPIVPPALPMQMNDMISTSPPPPFPQPPPPPPPPQLPPRPLSPVASCSYSYGKSIHEPRLHKSPEYQPTVQVIDITNESGEIQLPPRSTFVQVGGAGRGRGRGRVPQTQSSKPFKPRKPRTKRSPPPKKMKRTKELTPPPLPSPLPPADSPVSDNPADHPSAFSDTEEEDEETINHRKRLAAATAASDQAFYGKAGHFRDCPYTKIPPSRQNAQCGCKCKQ